jgi:uncharacterized membrane protein
MSLIAKYKHAANIELVDNATLGGRAADSVAAFIGSWKFIIGQTIFICGWIILNIWGLTHHWDVYPFILLNLMLSMQATYASPIILLSQNRQSQHDRLSAETDLAADLQALSLLKTIAAKLEIPVEE